MLPFINILMCILLNWERFLQNWIERYDIGMQRCVIKFIIIKIHIIGVLQYTYNSKTCFNKQNTCIEYLEHYRLAYVAMVMITYLMHKTYIHSFLMLTSHNHASRHDWNRDRINFT